MQEGATTCALEGARYLFFSPNVPDFVYYSHIPVFIVISLIAIFVITRRNRKLSHYILFWTTTPFLFWLFLDSIFWASNRSDIITFVWSALILIEPLIYAGIFYLQFNLLKDRPLPLKYTVLLSVLFLPLILFVPTTLTLSAFDISSCVAVKEFFGLYYSYGVEAIFIFLIALLGIHGTINAKEKRERLKALSISAIILFSLLLFTAGNISEEFTPYWEVGQVGLLGMLVLFGFLTHAVVDVQSLRLRAFTAKILFVILLLLLSSALFVDSISNMRIIIGSALITFSILGFAFIQTLQRGEEQRREIEKLTEKLQRANKRVRVLDQMKSEFVSIASHQLRSPLTSIRGYTSMLLEGSYGKIPKKAEKAVSHIHESSRYMALSVEDFLNVSRIESGKMKYEFSTFNVKEVAKDIVNEARQTAMQKGLLLTFESKYKNGCVVRADISKVRQVLRNLIDNAIKYTPRGDIVVSVHDDPTAKTVQISVRDTGVGMDKETMKEVFEKFIRAKNANDINATGGGLGLFIAKEMIEHMGGTITPSSEGKGKGSTFTLTLPLVGKHSKR